MYHRDLTLTPPTKTYEPDEDAIRRDRWLPSVSMWLISLISYIDRNTLAILAPAILAETHLSAEQYGFIISCFSVAYMIGNPVWGILLDRLGVRRGMTAAVGVWTVASAAHAWAGGFLSFGLLRAVLGAGEGATFPGGFRTVNSTLSPSKRGRGLAIAYSGGSLGAMVTPLIVTPIAVAFGWRGAFVFTGLLGALWLLFWQATTRGVDSAAVHTPPPALGAIWKRPALWAFMGAYGLGALPLGFILYDSSLYLHARFGWSQATLGKVLWIPPFGWEVGYFVWGAIVDKFRNSFRGLMFASVVFILPLAAIHALGTGPQVVIDMFLAMFGSAGLVVLSLGWVTRAFPRGYSGFLAGAGAGSWGAIVAITTPWFGRLFDHGRYAVAFQTATLISVSGYLVWRVLSRHVRPGPSAEAV